MSWSLKKRIETREELSVGLFEQYRKQVDSCLELQRESVKADSGIAHALIESAAGEITVMAFTNDFMESAEGKNTLAGQLFRKLLELRGKCVVFCSDAWSSNLPPGVALSQMPEDMGLWPASYRSEMLICTVNALGSPGELARQRYTRNESGKPVFGVLEIERNVKFNRFVFDLRQEVLEARMRRIMARRDRQ